MRKLKKLDIEIEVNGKKILVKTAGGYSSDHISELTNETMIEVGYPENNLRLNILKTIKK